MHHQSGFFMGLSFLSSLLPSLNNLSSVGCHFNQTHITIVISFIFEKKAYTQQDPTWVDPLFPAPWLSTAGEKKNHLEGQIRVLVNSFGQLRSHLNRVEFFLIKTLFCSCSYNFKLYLIFPSFLETISENFLKFLLPYLPNVTSFSLITPCLPSITIHFPLICMLDLIVS